MIDTTRFFVNQAAIQPLTREEQTSVFSSSQHCLIDPKICVTKAKEIYQQCLANLGMRASDYLSESASKQETIRFVRGLGTFYSGAIGPLLYLPWRISTLIRVSEPVTADDLLTKACRMARVGVRVWEHQLTNELRKCSRVTLLECPYVGVKVMYAVLLHSTGQEIKALQEASELIHWLEIACSNLSASENEILYGRAGALEIILFLRQELRVESIGLDLAVNLATAILIDGRSRALAQPRYGFPLLYEWNESKYLGAAHGLVGILQMLLSMTSHEWDMIQEKSSIAVDEKLGDLVKSTIFHLQKFCWPSGNLDSSIKEGHNIDRLVHWCHGATGHVILLIKAYEVYHEQIFLDFAKEIAHNVIWPRGLLRKGVGLCHGISGNTYAILAVARHDVSFIPKAHYFASFAVENIKLLVSIPDRPFSLYEGLGGLCILLIDLGKHDVRNVKFPLYEF